MSDSECSTPRRGGAQGQRSRPEPVVDPRDADFLWDLQKSTDIGVRLGGAWATLPVDLVSPLRRGRAAEGLDAALTGIAFRRCSGTWRVTEIFIPNKGIAGTLPASVGGLSMVKLLSLKMNRLTGSVPKALEACSKLRQVELQENQFDGDFEPTALLARICQELEAGAEVSRTFISLYGNRFKPVSIPSLPAFTAGTVACGVKIAMASFCGSEALSWLIMLSLWHTGLSQCCVFLEEYTRALGSSEAPSEWHTCGKGSAECCDNARYFDMASGATGGESIEGHARFGCGWFGQWRANIDRAIRDGHDTFVLVTKLDGTIGVCQTVERCYLQEMKQTKGIQVVQVPISLAGSTLIRLVLKDLPSGRADRLWMVEYL